MAPSVKPAQYGPVDPNDVCDVVKDGSPDLYHARPRRYITKDEAKYRGWTHFWDPSSYSPCKAGHNAARYVSNIAICVDCKRVKDGFLPLYPTQAQLERLERSSAACAPTPASDKTLPDELEQRFLNHYAQTRSFAEASKLVERPESEFVSRLSYKPIFRKAVHQLEEDLGIKETKPVNAKFDWDQEKRDVLVITYINTGDMTAALAAIEVSPYQFHREVEENPSFRAQLEEAEPYVHQLYKWMTEKTAIKGDSRSLMRMAASLFPDQFGERLKLDMNVKTVRSQEKDDAAIAQMLERLTKAGKIKLTEAIDGEFSVVAPAGEAPVADDVGERRLLGPTHDNSDLV